MGNMREEAERLIRQAQQQAEAARQQHEFEKQQAQRRAWDAELPGRRQEIETWKRVSQLVNQALYDSRAEELLRELQKDLWQGKGKISINLASVNPYTPTWLNRDGKQKEHPPEAWLDASARDQGLHPPVYNHASVGLDFERGRWRTEGIYRGANTVTRVGTALVRYKVNAGLRIAFSVEPNTIQVHYDVSELVKKAISIYTYSCEPIAYDLANMQAARQKISTQLAELHADAFQHKATPPQL